MTARRFAVPDPAWATPSLFPDLVPLALPAGARRSLSADRRRTARQHLDIARGRHPLTRGPLTAKLRATCGNCTHRVLVDGGRHRAYPKCEVSVMTRAPPPTSAPGGPAAPATRIRPTCCY